MQNNFNKNLVNRKNHRKSETMCVYGEGKECSISKNGTLKIKSLVQCIIFCYENMHNVILFYFFKVWKLFILVEFLFLWYIFCWTLFMKRQFILSLNKSLQFSRIIIIVIYYRCHAEILVCSTRDTCTSVTTGSIALAAHICKRTFILFNIKTRTKSP